MTHSIGAVARTFGAAVGVLIVVLFLAEIAGRLSTPASANSAATARASAARR